MLVAKEGIENMTPTVSKSVEKITRGVKKGLKDDRYSKNCKNLKKITKSSCQNIKFIIY